MTDRSERSESAKGTLRPTEALRVATDDGAKLYVEVTGKQHATLTLVFVHGWALSLLTWTAQAREFGTAARIVCYDQRGHGRSSWGQTDSRANQPGIVRLGADLAAVLDQVAPKGQVVLVGHSMGGMTIMALAALRPELFDARVAGVALIATSADRAAETAGKPPLLAPQRWLMAAAGRYPAAFDRIRRMPPVRAAHRQHVRRSLFGPSAPRDAVLSCAGIIDATPMRTVAGFFPALLAHDQQASLPTLRGVPALVMVGEADRITPVTHSLRLAAALPAAPLVVVPGCGHLLPMERPDTVTTHLRDLLNRAGDPHPWADRYGTKGGTV